MILLQYFLALLLTIIIEFGITLLFRFKNKKILGAVLAANLITHSSLHLIILLISIFNSIQLPTILLLELLIIFAEWKLVEFGMGCKSNRFLILSIIMNTVSYFVGVMIQLYI